MRPSFSLFPISLFLLLLLLLLTFQCATGNNTIHDTCKKTAQNDPNLSYGFCVTSLEAAPGSHCANLRQLGMISIKLIRNNATNTRYYIKELLKNKRLDPYIRGCLVDCFGLYSDVIPTLKQAMKDYKSKHYLNANIEVSSAMDASSTCEDGFKEKKGAVSPLTKRNNNTLQLSAITLSIINMLR